MDNQFVCQRWRSIWFWNPVNKYNTQWSEYTMGEGFVFISDATFNKIPVDVRKGVQAKRKTICQRSRSASIWGDSFNLVMLCVQRLAERLSKLEYLNILDIAECVLTIGVISLSFSNCKITSLIGNNTTWLYMIKNRFRQAAGAPPSSHGVYVHGFVCEY